VLRRSADAVSGKTYTDAQTVFCFTTANAGNGQSRVTLVPEVRHGPARTRFAGMDGSLTLAAARDCEVLDDLSLHALLVPGQTLIVTSTNEPLTVGANFLQCVDDTRRQRKLLLIRLIRAGQDSLYHDTDGRLTIHDL
jgi:hypothetical protein